MSVFTSCVKTFLGTVWNMCCETTLKMVLKRFWKRFWKFVGDAGLKTVLDNVLKTLVESVWDLCF